eukprot:gene121-biopygen36
MTEQIHKKKLLSQYLTKNINDSVFLCILEQRTAFVLFFLYGGYGRCANGAAGLTDNSTAKCVDLCARPPPFAPFGPRPMPTCARHNELTQPESALQAALRVSRSRAQARGSTGPEARVVPPRRRPGVARAPAQAAPCDPPRARADGKPPPVATAAHTVAGACAGGEGEGERLGETGGQHVEQERERLESLAVVSRLKHAAFRSRYYSSISSRLYRLPWAAGA